MGTFIVVYIVTILALQMIHTFGFVFPRKVSKATYRAPSMSIKPLTPKETRKFFGVETLEPVLQQVPAIRAIDSKGKHSPPMVTPTKITAALKSDGMWKLGMLGVCLAWSTNYAVIKCVYDSMPNGQLDASLMLAIRFSIAAAVMTPGILGKLKNSDLVMNSILVGCSIFVGYFGQSIGLMSSSADKSAFFCSLHVVWVSVVTALMDKHMKLQSGVAVAMAVAGLALIELQGSAMPSAGDMWLLLQPVGFGSSYILLDRLMKKYPGESGTVTSLQLITVAVCSVASAVSHGHTLSDLAPIAQSPIALAGLLYCSLFTTVFAIWLQSVSFKKVPAQDASLILSSEPVWATLFASALLHEGVGATEVEGGGLIVSACLVKELNLVDKMSAHLAALPK